MRSYQYTLLGILLLAPAFAQAQAYLGPEDVLYLNVQSQRLNPRSAEKTVQEREANHVEVKNEDRPMFREWWEVPSDETAGVDETVTAHPAAGEAPVIVTVPSETKDTVLHPGANIDPATLRLLERLQYGNYVAVPVTTGYKPSKLIHTGPESIVALLAMIPAGFYVVRRARKMEKFLR